MWVNRTRNVIPPIPPIPTSPFLHAVKMSRLRAPLDEDFAGELAADDLLGAVDADA